MQAYCNIFDYIPNSELFEGNPVGEGTTRRGDYIPYSVHYVPVTYLFYNWKFVHLNHLHLFHPTLIRLPSGDHQFVLCIYEPVSLLSSTYK